MAFARQHDGVARFRHKHCAPTTDGTDFAVRLIIEPSADQKSRAIDPRSACTSEMVDHADARTRRGKAKMWATKTLRDVRPRFIPLRALWRVSKRKQWLTFQNDISRWSG